MLGAYAALWVIELVVVISYHFDWMAGPMGLTLTILIALVLSVPAGLLVRKFVWIAIGLNGIF